MPGIRELLPALQSRDDILLGLLTGNFEEAARIKLEHFDLWRHFRCGAFGDDAADRNELVPFARRARTRAAACRTSTTPTSSSSATRRTMWRAPRPSAPLPVAVATGSFTVEQLRDQARRSCCEDLSDTAAFLRLLDSVARGRDVSQGKHWPSPVLPHRVATPRSEMRGSESAPQCAWESNPAQPARRAERPVSKTGRATGPLRFRSWRACLDSRRSRSRRLSEPVQMGTLGERGRAEAAAQSCKVQLYRAWAAQQMHEPDFVPRLPPPARRLRLARAGCRAR